MGRVGADLRRANRLITHRTVIAPAVIITTVNQPTRRVTLIRRVMLDAR